MAATPRREITQLMESVDALQSALDANKRAYVELQQRHVELEEKFKKEEQERIRLTNLNKDMDAQIRDLLSRDALTPEQMAEYARVKKEHIELVEAQGEIIFYLREKYVDDFKRGGVNSGLSLGKIVLRYLKGE